jgi:hypothetical protein
MVCYGECIRVHFETAEPVSLISQFTSPEKRGYIKSK